MKYMRNLKYKSINFKIHNSNHQLVFRINNKEKKLTKVQKTIKVKSYILLAKTYLSLLIQEKSLMESIIHKTTNQLRDKTLICLS